MFKFFEITDVDIDYAESLGKLLLNNKVENLTFTGIMVDMLFNSQDLDRKLNSAEVNLIRGFGQLILGDESLYFGEDYIQSILPDLPPSRINSFPELFLLYLVLKLEKIDLINYFASTLSSLHNNLSLGQAVAAVKRVLSISLNSQERTQLSRLRKKVNDSYNIIQGFNFLLGSSRMIISTSSSTPAKYVYFYCKNCDNSYNLTGNLMQVPQHCGRDMQLFWSVSKPSLPHSEGINEIEERLSSDNLGLQSWKSTKKQSGHKIFLVCQECPERFEIDDKLMNRISKSDQRIPLPKHHNKEMTLSINSDRFSNEKSGDLIKRIIEPIMILMEKGEDLSDYIILECEVCSTIICSLKSAAIPEHHGKVMTQILAYYTGKSIS